MSNIKNPPSFNPEADDYASWKSDIEVWKLITDMTDVKIGAAVYLALQGKAREVVRTLSTAEIGAADGYTTITNALDAVYQADASSLAFSAFTEFYEFRREAGQDFAQFIVEYEKRYFKVKRSLIGELADGVQAFFLLKAANLTAESENLALATAKLEFKDMRDKIMKIFGDPGVLDDSRMVPDVKQEALYGHGYEKGRGRGFRGGYEGVRDSGRDGLYSRVQDGV